MVVVWGRNEWLWCGREMSGSGVRGEMSGCGVGGDEWV